MATKRKKIATNGDRVRLAAGVLKTIIGNKINWKTTLGKMRIWMEEGLKLVPKFKDIEIRRRLKFWFPLDKPLKRVANGKTKKKSKTA